MNKYKGLKQAVGDFNRWQGHAKIMFDKSDNLVWCDVFDNSQSWSEYDSNDVVVILSKKAMLQRDIKTSMKEVTQMIEEQTIINAL